jgi:ADP-L-glycero-D-manno-heptose 6-epimerase
MRILVTGAAGFIGSHLAITLSRDGHEVVGVDDFQSAQYSNLVEFSGDLRTLDLADGHAVEVLRKDRFDAIVHQASITDTTVHDQYRMMNNNVEAFRSLLDLAHHWNARVVWASSASIYGQNPAPNAEHQSPDPLNVYAFSKLSMERLAAIASRTLPRGIVGLRYFNVYGPGEDHKGKFASMIHQLAKQMREGRRPRIFTAGEQKRDFVYVGDVVSANQLALLPTAPHHGVFNVGSGEARSFNDVVAELNRALRTNLAPDYFENPYNFTQDHTEADLSLSREKLKYNPAHDLRRGIEAYAQSGKLGIGR